MVHVLGFDVAVGEGAVEFALVGFEGGFFFCRAGDGGGAVGPRGDDGVVADALEPIFSGNGGPEECVAEGEEVAGVCEVGVFTRGVAEAQRGGAGSGPAAAEAEVGPDTKGIVAVAGEGEEVIGCGAGVLDIRELNLLLEGTAETPLKEGCFVVVSRGLGSWRRLYQWGSFRLTLRRNGGKALLSEV